MRLSSAKRSGSSSRSRAPGSLNASHAHIGGHPSRQSSEHRIVDKANTIAEFKYLDPVSKRVLNERFVLKIKAQGLSSYYPKFVSAAKK